MGKPFLFIFVLLYRLIIYQIAAVVEADVLEYKRFAGQGVSKRRRDHIIQIYRKIIVWFTALRDGIPIPNLSPESREQAVQGIGLLSQLTLPDLP